MSILKNPADRSGMLRQNVAVRQVGTRTVVKSRPSYKRESTPRQLEIQKKFLAAADWAKWKLTQPGQEEAYRSRTNSKIKSVYMVAVSDYLNAPEVKSIDAKKYRGAIGDLISIHAFDDFMVTKVEVEIRNAAGAIIEQGEAIQSTEHNQFWIYKAMVANPVVTGITVKAIAYDNPGNQGILDVVLP
jgi:hypothetical protein